MVLIKINHSEAIHAIENFKKVIYFGLDKKCRFLTEIEQFLRDFGVTVLPTENSYKVAISKLHKLTSATIKQELPPEQTQKLIHWTTKIAETIHNQLQKRSTAKYKPKKHRVIHASSLHTENANYLID